ncbi:MAG: phosphate ABC transporter ATP-binding protein [Clostridiales bacterium]|jgi:tungstate transport system ATP-binding protein|nr:phosphate ABC transporter ATP-binding protein [Clostridiales bacterium]
MENTNGIIEAIGLSKSYHKKEVLRIDQMTIRSGGITCVMGPSGAGKSTMLRIVNMLEVPTTGEVNYFGQPVPTVPADRLKLQRRMTMVFQKAALLDMSVYENIAFGLHARRIPPEETRRRVMTALETVGMSEQRSQRGKTLSAGEAQRVAFARAAVLQPEVLLLDEPTANLDPANVELLETMILDLNREHGTTILMVTHNLFQARRLAHDVMFFYQGQLLESGSTERVFNTPANEYTRSFVEGSMVY